MSDENIGAPFEIWVGSVDEPSLKVKAQFNPKELQVDKTVPWTKAPKSMGDRPHLEFTGAEGRSMSLELLFDGYETNESVQGKVDMLIQMSSARIATSKKPDEKRPHQIQVVWGQGAQ